MKQTITIPKGCKATIDHDNGVIIIESKEEQMFKKGDIVTVAHPSKGKWIFIYNTLSRDDYFYFANYNYLNGELLFDDYCYCIGGEFKSATLEEKQLLFDTLSKQGKYWDEEALEIKDFIKVPENIGVYKAKSYVVSNYNKGDGLFIGFNNSKQLLSTSDGLYNIQPNDKALLERVQCYLKPCKRDELKEGDTFFAHDEEKDFDSIDMYNKMLANGYIAYTSGNIGVGVLDDDDYNFYYKLIPMNG